MSGIKDSETSVQPMIRFKSLKDFAFLFKKFTVRSFLEIGAEKYMINNLIIESWRVVKEIQMPIPYVYEPELVPFFEQEEFPYIIFRYGGFFMVNIKEETVQKIVEAKGQNGFCIKTGDQAFDFHFTNVF